MDIGETNLTNMQRRAGTVIVTNPDGTNEPVTGLTINPVMGDATISMTAKDGTAYPVEKFAIISGSSAGDSVFEAVITTAARSYTGTITAHVANGQVTISIQFDEAEDK